MTGILNPEVLIVARESRGKSQIEVATAAGTNQGHISKAENGILELPDEMLERVAAFLQYPIELFFEPGRIREEGSACLYHRKRKTLPASILKRLNGKMFIRNINVRRLLLDLSVDGDRMFHTMDPDEFGGSPEGVAKNLRAVWNVPAGPIPNLTALIESAGAVVLFANFGTRKLFGMSCWTTRNNPLFFLNAGVPMADLRWTMAHELGHLTMHRHAPESDPEAQADAFAAEFLTPGDLIKPSLWNLQFDQLGPLKMNWRVSMKALIKRATTLGCIDKDRSVRLYKQFSARGYNTHEPYEIPDESPELAYKAIEVHLHDHGYTMDELAFALRLTREELEGQFQRETGATPPSPTLQLVGK